MRTKKLGNSDLEVSVIALGTWPMGGSAYGDVDDKESIATIQAAIDAGINLIDTAPAYGTGRAEEIVGKAIKGRRNQVHIATKVGIVRTDDGVKKSLKPESIRKEIDDSLRRLNVDVIDVYQIHWPDYSTPLEDSLAELVKLQEAGKFRYLGVSNFDQKLMDTVRKHTTLTCLQPQYSLLHRDIEQELLPYCRQHNIGILAYGPLGSGILAGRFKTRPKIESGRFHFYPFFKEPMWSKAMQLVKVLTKIAEEHNKPLSHIAINWLTQQPGVTSALVGARHPQQIIENAGAGNWELSEAELSHINREYNRIFA